jgi:hypothetical protein
VTKAWRRRRSATNPLDLLVLSAVQEQAKTPYNIGQQLRASRVPATFSSGSLCSAVDRLRQSEAITELETGRNDWPPSYTIYASPRQAETYLRGGVRRCMAEPDVAHVSQGSLSIALALLDAVPTGQGDEPIQRRRATTLGLAEQTSIDLRSVSDTPGPAPCSYRRNPNSSDHAEVAFLARLLHETPATPVIVVA